MNCTKMYQADLDSSCRDLSNGGLRIVVALLVCWQIDFSCVSTGGPIQLYVVMSRVKTFTEVSAQLRSFVYLH